MRTRRSPVRLSAPLWLFVSTLVLTAIGLLFVLESSVSESYLTFGDQYFLFKQQAIGAAIGLILFFIGQKTPVSLLLKHSWMLFAGSIVLLILVFIPPFGMELNGAHRWLNLGIVRLQPVEFLKFSLVAFYASWLAKHQRIGPFLALTAIPALLIILQPDLGSLLLIFVLAFSMYFYAGGSIKKVSIIGVILIPFVVAAIVFSPYRLQRLTTFLNPQEDPLGASFQVRQISYALGRGGWLGQGIGQSQQKYSYIPEASTDSIFAIIAEELGFVGSVVLLSLYMSFLYSGYRCAVSANTKAEMLLALGIVTWISTQALLNLSAVVQLVPLTGTPLPLFSYGRSSLVMVLFATGLLIQIGKQRT